MAEKIVSPGVFTRENDLTFLPQGVAAIGATIIAPFSEGPTVPTVVTSVADLENWYGKADDNYYGPLAARYYLGEAGQVTICRVSGRSGYTQKNPLLLIVSGAGGSKALSLLFDTDEDVSPFTNGITLNGGLTTGSFQGAGIISGTVNNTGANTDFGFGLSGSNFGVVSASLYAGASNNTKFAFGTSPKGTKEAYSVAFFGDSAQTGLFPVGGTLAVSGAILGNQSYAVAAKPAYTPLIKSQLTGGDRSSVLQFFTLGAGEPTNTKVKISIYNIKPSGIIAGSDYGTFSLLVRAFSDTDKRKESYESYSNLTLDPTSPNYVLRVIGNRSKVLADNGNVTEYGDYPNFSKYVRCWNEGDADWVSPEAINATAVPYGHAAYKLMVSASSYWSNLIPAVTYNAASSTVFGGIDIDNNDDNANYMRPIPVNAGTGSNVDFALDASNGGGLTLSGSLQNDVNKRRFTVAFQGGFNGVNPTKLLNKANDISSTNTQGFDVSTTTSEGYLAYLSHINALSNADEYDTNLVITPGLIREYHSTLVDKVLEMVENRGDCFYILDAVAFDGTIEEVNAQAQELDTNYAAIYYPWVKAVNPVTTKVMAVPPSTLLPAVYAANDRITAEWYAPAGLNRGGLNGAVAVITKLSQDNRDTLYEAKVNPIAQFPGQGIVAFGQKTLQDKSSALDRINVRRLLLTVRKFVASASRYLVFEQNTAETRQKFINIVNPYLEGIQQRQGLYAFRVQMDEALNTADMIDRGILKGAIFLQPTRTAEFIIVDFNILPTGASFGA